MLLLKGVQNFKGPREGFLMVFRRFGAPPESFLRLFGEFSGGVGKWLRETFLRLFGKFSGGLGKWPRREFLEPFGENVDKPDLADLEHYGGSAQIASQRQLAYSGHL